MPDWDALFNSSVPLLEIFVRGTVTFLVLTILMRLAGQRETGGLGITDVLIVVLVADAASAGLTGNMSSIPDSVVLVSTILFWSVALDAISYRWPRLGGILKAKPRMLIENGKLNRHVMHRELMSYDEVLSQLRLHGLTNLSQVKHAYLEPNGMVSIIANDDHQENEQPDDEDPQVPPGSP